MRLLPSLRGLAIGGVVLLSLGAGGCASFRGQPEPLEAKTDALAAIKGEYARVKVLPAYEKLLSDKKAAYRNEVAYIWIGASDAQYNAFKASLSREMKGSAFGSALTVLVLNGAAAVSGAEGARALAVGSATVVGASGALNKDVFQDRTISGVISTMDAARTRKLTALRRRLLLETAADFPLGDALTAVSELNDSASLFAAADQIAATAAEAKTAADAEAKTVPATRVALLSPELQAVRVQFKAYVLGLDDASPQLQQLRTALGAANDAQPRELKQNIIDKYVEQATGTEVVNALTAPLKAITGKEFKA